MACFLFRAQSDVAPGGLERFVLNFPGVAAEALGYVMEHEIGGKGQFYACTPLPIPEERQPLMLCQQVKERSPQEQVVEGQVVSEAGAIDKEEYLTGKDFDGEEPY